MTNKSLLQLRNKMKSKKPKFERQDTNVYPQFKGIWRKPKGIHSKLRRGFRGHKMIPSIGYASPRAVKGLTRDGLKILLINNVNDLKKITSQNLAMISSVVGTKKKIEILSKAQEMKINVGNAKDITQKITQIKQKIELNKKSNKEKKEQRSKAKEEAVVKKETKGEQKDEPKK